MMLSDDEEYSSPVLEILDKESTNIEEDLELQVLNSTRSFHHEELCGWAASRSDLDRFRWNNIRKHPKTATRDHRTQRRSFSRQSLSSKGDIDFEFHHFQNGMAYIEQYRGEKMKRYEAELNEYLARTTPRKSSDSCEDCTRNQEQVVKEKPKAPVLLHRDCRESIPSSPLVVITSSRASLNHTNANHIQGRRLYSRPMAYIRTQQKRDSTNWSNAVSDETVQLSSAGPYHSNSLQITSPYSAGKESLGVIGKEKRPLPSHKKIIDCNLTTQRSPSANKSKTKVTKTSNSYTRRQSSIPLSNSWVKTKEQDLNQYSIEGGIRGSLSRRSVSAPNIGYNDGKSDWQSKADLLRTGTSDAKARASPPTQGGGHNGSTSVDYSCYTEMFKNVLEYYGTNRLRPNANSQANTESSTLLSVRT